MRKAKFFFTLTAVVLCCCAVFGCGKGGDSEAKGDKISNTFPAWSDSAKDAMSVEWLYVPGGCDIVSVTELGSAIGVTFSGCAFSDINAYAEDIRTEIIKAGFALLDLTADGADLTEPSTFENAVSDDWFYGEAYSFLYHGNGKFYELTIEYYGCAGGNEENALSIVTVFDRTEDYKEFCNE